MAAMVARIAWPNKCWLYARALAPDSPEPQSTLAHPLRLTIGGGACEMGKAPDHRAGKGGDMRRSISVACIAPRRAAGICPRP
jgi:hypothetical protein